MDDPLLNDGDSVLCPSILVLDNHITCADLNFWRLTALAHCFYVLTCLFLCDLQEVTCPSQSRFLSMS